MIALAIGAGLPACSGKAASTPPPRAISGNTTVTPGRAADLGRDLEATVLEGYSQLNLGNLEAYRDGFTTERLPEAIGVLTDRTATDQPAARVPDPRLFPALEPNLLSKNLDVHVSTKAPVGWVYDEISYRITYGGRAASIPIRRTAVYVVEGGRWALVQEHLSYPLALQEMSTLAAQGRLPRPLAVAGQGTESHAGRELAALIARLPSAAGAERQALLSAAPYSLLLYPDLDGEYAGAQVRKAPQLAPLFGPSATVAVDGVRVHIGPGGRVAWGMCNMAVRGFLGAKTPEQEIGFRASYVLERSDEQGWQVVQAHVSAPVTEAIIKRDVLGEPGGE
jgi:ketosteroid isomerase-like protein